MAVIIPRRVEVAKIVGKAELTEEEWNGACADKSVKEAILATMNEAAKARGLFGFQQVKAIHLDTRVGTADNEAAKAFADYYREELDALYEEYGAGPTPQPS